MTAPVARDSGLRRNDAAIGPVAWFGVLTAAALMLVLALTFMPAR